MPNGIRHGDLLTAAPVLTSLLTASSIYLCFCQLLTLLQRESKAKERLVRERDTGVVGCAPNITIRGITMRKDKHDLRTENKTNKYLYIIVYISKKYTTL